MKEISWSQFIFLDIVLQYDSSTLFPIVPIPKYERRRIFTRSSKTRPTAIKNPTMELRLSSEQGCLPSSNRYICEGESNGMEYDERQGEISTKERENGRVRSGTGTGWRSKIELEKNEREVLGAVCWILEINTTYPISSSLVVLQTIACVTHVHVPNITSRSEVRCCADWFWIFYETGC